MNEILDPITDWVLIVTFVLWVVPLLYSIHSKIKSVMRELQTLREQVAASVTVQESAITLLNGLKAALDAAIQAAKDGDPAALQTLSDNIAAETKKLSDAVAANTIAGNTL